MEYLQQQAELNYMLAVLKDLKMQTINQKALLARVIMVGKDKALDGLADSIHIDYNPNFMDVALEAEGDEWVGGATFYDSSLMGEHGLGVDISNLPDDLNGLLSVLLEAVSHGEAKSPEAYNNGTKPCGLSKAKIYGDGKTFITKMTPVQILARRNNDCSTRLFATGIWQTIPDTLEGALRAMPELKNQPYTRENQKKVALWLILQDPIRKDLSNFLTGKNNDINKAQQILAMIWASIPVPAGMRISHGRVSDGTKSYYESRYNKANKESGIMVRAVLEKIQQYHRSKNSSNLNNQQR